MQIYSYIQKLHNGSTPLNKLSIGIHANIVLRNRHSTPHFTIFLKVLMTKIALTKVKL